VDRLPLILSSDHQRLGVRGAPGHGAGYDHKGNAHNITMEPGDVIAIQKASCSARQTVCDEGECCEFSFISSRPSTTNYNEADHGLRCSNMRRSRRCPLLLQPVPSLSPEGRGHLRAASIATAQSIFVQRGSIAGHEQSNHNDNTGYAAQQDDALRQDELKCRQPNLTPNSDGALDSRQKTMKLSVWRR
jgi:hypothetical protein